MGAVCWAVFWARTVRYIWLDFEQTRLFPGVVRCAFYASSLRSVFWGKVWRFDGARGRRGNYDGLYFSVLCAPPMMGGDNECAERMASRDGWRCSPVSYWLLPSSVRCRFWHVRQFAAAAAVSAALLPFTEIGLLPCGWAVHCATARRLFVSGLAPLSRSCMCYAAL